MSTSFLGFLGEEIQSFKIQTGDVGPQVGGEEISQKNLYVRKYILVCESTESFNGVRMLECVHMHAILCLSWCFQH